MSQENVEIVRRVYEYRPGDEEFLEVLDPHVVWINYSSMFDATPYVGPEGVLKWAKEFRDHFESLRIRASEYIDSGGDHVVVVGQITGIGRTSRTPIERELSSVFTLLNGKIVRAQGFETRAEALEAAGLSE